MKHYQLILTAALIALTGCNKAHVESFNTASNDEIGFNAVASMATKAIISGTTYGTENSFKVWGWQSPEGDFSEFTDNASSNFMSNLTISFTKGADADHHELAWRNAEHYYYWPFTGKISFLAIHPSTVAPSTTGWNATYDAPTATIADYTIASTNETVDLMFATNQGGRTAEALPMVFKHALSQIEVKVKTDQNYSTDVAFDVESVTFKNIDLSGDVTFSNNAISWGDNTTQSQNWVYCGTAKEDITNEYQVYGSAKVMIPQPSNEATVITIGYSMEQTSSAKITGTVDVTLPQLWEAGKKYNYTLNFRLNEILFNPTVTDWVDVNVSTINIF